MMGWGMTLNGIYWPRVRRTELPCRQDDAEASMERIRARLICLAAMSPHDVTDDDGYAQTWQDYVVSEVFDLCDEYAEESVNERYARHAQMFPDECQCDSDPEQPTE